MYSVAARTTMRRCMSYNHYPACQLLARNFCATEGKIKWRGTQRPKASNKIKYPRGRKDFFQKRRRKPERNFQPQQVRRGDESKERIQSIFIHLGNLLTSYQEKLFGGIEENIAEERKKRKRGIINNTFSQFECLNAMCYEDDNILKLDWSRIEETENIFKNISLAMKNAVRRTTYMQDHKEDLAERLLIMFLDLRRDRANLVRSSKPKEQPKSFLSSASTWLSDTFVSSEGKEDTPQETVTAHKDSSIAPTARHLSDIIRRVFYDIPNNETSSSILSERVDRLVPLLELQSHEGMESKQNLKLILRAQAAVGTLERANEAEKIWRKYGSGYQTFIFFNEVLRAYELASSREKKIEQRSRAVLELEKLILQEWNLIRTGQGTDEGKSIEIVLKALSIAPIKKVPDRCKRAENLVIKYMGQNRFRDMFVDIDEAVNKKMELIPTSDMQMLRHLVVLYSSQQDPKSLKQGMQILRYLELQHEMRQLETKTQGRKRTDKKTNERDLTLDKDQWLEMYRAVIVGIRSYTFSSKRNHNNKNTQDSLDMVDLAIYASELLNKMSIVGASPDVDIFNRLIKLWLRVKSSKSGEYAENILSRMQIREVYDPSITVTEEIYQSIIRCWNSAAKLGHPEAAERVSYLLRSMEVQSGIYELPREDDLSEVEEEIHESVYNKNVRPTQSTYNNALAVCGHPHKGPMKENAVDEALDIHKRFLDAKFESTSETYLSLFKCLNKNLHKDSPRRILVGKDLLELSKTSGIVLDSSVVKALKEVDSSLHREYLKDLDSASMTEE